MEVIKTYNLTYATENFDYQIQKYSDGIYRYTVNGEISDPYFDYDMCKLKAIHKIEEIFYF